MLTNTIGRPHAGRPLLYLGAVILMSLLNIFGGNAQAGVIHTTDSLATIKSNIASGAAVLVDVRESDEWNAGHIKGAIFAPLSVLRTLPPGLQPNGVPTGKILYVYCRSGNRAIPATEILLKAKNDARALKLGYSALAPEF